MFECFECLRRRRGVWRRRKGRDKGLFLFRGRRRLYVSDYGLRFTVLGILGFVVLHGRDILKTWGLSDN